MEKSSNFKQKFQKVKTLRPRFLDIANKIGTPLYIYDKEETRKNIQTFKNAFKKEGLNINIFFATKSNYYPGLLKTVVQEKEGLDVSSQRELKLAIKAGAKKIIYTGPGKTEKDFELILKYHNKITVNLESIRELILLAKMAEKKKVKVQCGLRIYTKAQTGWTKFGTSLENLKTFFDTAKKYKSINFCGIHFHISYNKTPEKYIKTFKTLAEYLKENFTENERKQFEYIDMGGGFYPQPFEGIHPWNPDENSMDTPDEKDILETKPNKRYIPIKVDPIEKFAEEIVKIYKKEILPLLPNISLYAEPGRYICHSAMHMIFKIIDIKNPRLGITDGSNNMIGWERYQFFHYVPLFNLSQFDQKNEIPFVTYGSLCTPDDIWGYYLYTKNTPKEGDIIVMPFQGAYTYTFAQNFIKEVPPVYNL
ncbi:hypothetical protein COY05_00275 [Candidatus Peregrinibacteria bacterium CG_4_10_14_0_2_um_filter_38_24]|nr:MAG: hypothetical protein COY05_00275 [Candidatus Peregrinibacteria bacterium CG_4_10_14_0_2_um_filter_38_24]PJC39069.1 MAG: hypothetical protein CO044_01715 [Candidatus Peregrinibacteria bacterium CG_4_9_14_0_2_um_filter_38_9]